MNGGLPFIDLGLKAGSGVQVMMRAPTAEGLCETSAGSAQAVARDVTVLLHGSVSNSAMWRALTTALPASCRIVAPDLVGYGQSAAWQGERPFRLEHELAAIAAVLPTATGRWHVVGHSYGGLVALHLALADPQRVESLTLIEPVFVAALRYRGEMDAYDAFRRVRDDFVSRLHAGERDAAMRGFIDFWTGAGAWDALSPSARAESLKVADKIELDWEAALADDPGPDGLAALAPCTLLIRGDRSPAPMSRLVDVLHAFMPGSAQVIVPGANHLLPLTHGPAVNRAIAQHVAGAIGRDAAPGTA